MAYVYKRMASPVGELTLVASAKGLAAVLWEEDDASGRVDIPAGATQKNDDPLLCDAERQLNEYFSGHRKSFSIALDFAGTAFQKDVWHALLAIPYGETRSYKDIAAYIKKPKAMRAVGGANSKNPVSIIAPCHRVIGSNGHLTGFAGGIDKKKKLLDLEACYGA